MTNSFEPCDQYGSIYDLIPLKYGSNNGLPHFWATIELAESSSLSAISISFSYFEQNVSAVLSIWFGNDSLNLR